MLVVAAIVAIPRASLADEAQPFVPESEMVHQWQKHQDDEYGFAVEYPADWEVMTLVEQLQPYPEPEKIVRKYAFTGSEGYVTLSIFLTHGLELPAWLENQNKISPDLFPAMEANARVAGYPAAAFVMEDNLIVFVSNDEYVYRFWYPLTTSVTTLQANQRILDTFHSLRDGNVDSGSQIPQSIFDEVQNIMGTIENQILTCTDVLRQGCCDLPRLSVCDRFPCSQTSGGQHMGNCTYYVCYRYNGVPFSGNAGTWWNQVPNHPGWFRYFTPPTGRSIAWWGNPGHVGVIEFYWGSGTPLVHEQNYCISCTRTRSVWAQGYIQQGQPSPLPSSINSTAFSPH